MIYIVIIKRRNRNNIIIYYVNKAIYKVFLLFIIDI